VTPPLITASPFSLRNWSLEHEVKPLFARAFEAQPKVQSILLAVGQFWADEADDAVHGHLVFSTRHTPRWPHTCEDEYAGTAGDGDLCSMCAWDRTTGGMASTFVNWDSNGFAIRAWQAYCAEGASQEDDPSLSHTPVVVARRTPTGFTVDVIGRVLRPWLELPGAALPVWFLDGEEDPPPPVPAPVIAPRDPAERPFREAIARAPFDDGPRHVFADWLQQRQDPLGEFISLSLAPTRTPEVEARRQALLARHAEAWLGPLVKVVAPGSADFSRGLLTGAAVHFDEATRALADDPVFSTVEHLRFGATSEVLFSPAMTALRSVSGLRTRGVTLPGTVTDVACSVEAVATLPPHVRSLTVWIDEAPLAGEAIAAVRRAGLLGGLERLAIGCRALGMESVPAAPPTEVKTFAVGGWSDGGPSGYWLETGGGEATLTMRGPGAGSSVDFARFALGHLAGRGATRLTLAPGALWQPTSEDVALLTREAGVPVEVAGAGPAPEPPPLEPPPRPPVQPVPLPMRVDPITRAVHLDAPATGVGAVKRPLPTLPVVLIALGVAGLLARACAG
jgi:uncharacterized protein (TIGR02996 family)